MIQKKSMVSGILLVEDKIEDFVLLESYLGYAEMRGTVHTKNFHEVFYLFSSENVHFYDILLNLTLTDNNELKEDTRLEPYLINSYIELS